MKNSSIPKLEPLRAKAAEKSSNMLGPKPAGKAIDVLQRVIGIDVTRDVTYISQSDIFHFVFVS